jgi:hypothetical protein
MPNVDDVLAELAAVPPREFTRERSALVGRLIKAGQAKAAARVKAMPRPTTAVWAVNQLAREEPESVERLITASQRMRTAQLGRGKARDDLAATSASHRAALAHLNEKAEAILRRANVGATHRLLLRIGTTLTSAAADPALHRALRQGRIERELSARGFDVFGAEMPRRSPRVQARVETTNTLPREPTHDPRRRAEDQAATWAEARVASAREALAQSETEATARRERLTATRKRITELETLLRDATRAEREANGDVRRAAARVRAARVALHAAEKRRRGARRTRAD